MEEIKEAFSRVRKDIDFLYSEVISTKEELNEIKSLIAELTNLIQFSRDNEIQNIPHNSDKPPQTDRQTDTPTHNSTSQHINPITPTHNLTHSTHIRTLKPENLGLSNGNGGVPTDRQTDRQTDQQTDKSSYNHKNTSIEPIESAIEVLDSLDNLKKEIRLKFKRLTVQEMSVFSVLYQLSEQEGFSDYKTISEKLRLSESSIRDYIGRIIKKGIPVEKTKINNKTIHLSIPENLKKVATLPTILQLRGI